MGCSGSQYPKKASNDKWKYNTRTPIKHVILFQLENRSQDQIFGYRSQYPEPFRVNRSRKPGDEFYNLDTLNRKYYQEPIKAFSGYDCMAHDLKSTLFAMNGPNNRKDMSGFIQSNEYLLKDDNNASKTSLVPPEDIMGYFPKGSLPVFDYVADEFMICDRWFSSVPSMTLPNRVGFALCGTSDGHIDNKLEHGGGIDHKLLYHCDSIFDRLNDRHVPWVVYYNDFPLSLLIEHQARPVNLQNYKPYQTHFERDVQDNNLPAFTLIEPQYAVESAEQKIESVMNGQMLVKNVIEILQSNPAIWESSVLVVNWDENGGFYDSVYPPRCIPPKPPAPGDAYTFDQYGPRVPCMLISPRIPVGVDSRTVFDHTSVLKFIEFNWNIPYLTDRDKHANHFGHLILDTPRTDYRKLKDLDLEIQEHLSATTVRNFGARKDEDIAFFKSLLERHFIALLSDAAATGEEYLIHDKLLELKTRYF